MDDFIYNSDWEERDKIIFGNADLKRYCRGGTAHFKSMEVSTLQDLLDKEHADPQESHKGNALELQEIVDIANSFQSDKIRILLDGYTVSPCRKDYRVSISKIWFYSKNDNKFARSFLIEMLKLSDSIFHYELLLAEDERSLCIAW